MTNVPPTPANTAGVVVTYRPADDVADRITALARQVDRVYVVDNTPSPPAVLAPSRRVETVFNRDNLGVATALNIGTRLAHAAGYRWTLTMDQDSTAHPDLLPGLIAVYHDHPRRDRLGVVAANFRDEHRNRLFIGNVSTSRSYVDQPAVITSGSLVSVDAWRHAGPYRDDFFIDFVDHEFCLRLRRRRWVVTSTARPLIDHAIGHPVRHKFLWMRPATSNHSALRRYYITRNRLITAALYADTEPRAVVTDLCRLGGEAVAVSLFEPHRLNKLKAMLAGATDALLGRTGINQTQPAARPAKGEHG